MRDQTELELEEEAEAVATLEEALACLKKHLYLSSLRKAVPIKRDKEWQNDLLRRGFQLHVCFSKYPGRERVRELFF